VNRRFNLGDSATLLHTNPKTFKRWLAEDGIDAEKQLNRADSREKYVTEEQLVQMAQKRDIPLHLPDERKPESSATRILAAVDERFASLEQHLAGRFDQLAGEIHTVLADLRRDLEQPTHRLDQLDARLERMLAELQRAPASAPPQERPHAPTPRARNATPSASTATPPKPTAKKRGKGKTKTRKNLPGTLMPLSTFRQTHGISEKAAENAVQRNKLSVVRGAWLYQHRSISVALDRQGQQQFHALFYQREGFQRCEKCPHAL
jgi:uncharacterized coiled-coil protein SlyX